MRRIVAMGWLCGLFAWGAQAPVEAWNPTGHQVVVLVALDDTTDQTRKNIVTIMQQAPPEAGLASLFPKDGCPLDAREREFIRIASTWPDLVRSKTPAPRHAFPRTPWSVSTTSGQC
jgi:hypothetical protein